MSDELIQQIQKVAELKGNPDLEDPKKGNALINEALEEFYPGDSVRLKHLRKALNSAAGVGWDKLIQAKPAAMVAICVEFIEGGNEGGEAPTKKAPKKAPTKKATTKKAPVKKASPEEPEDEPEDEPEEQEEPPKEPKKRRPVRRGKAANTESEEESEEPEEPKMKDPVTRKAPAKTKEVVADIGAIEKYIDEKFDGLDKALLDVASTTDLQSLREEMMAEHARTRAMLQEFYSAVYKMIADEDFVPPAELDEG